MHRVTAGPGQLYTHSAALMWPLVLLVLATYWADVEAIPAQEFVRFVVPGMFVIEHLAREKGPKTSEVMRNLCKEIANSLHFNWF